ncbi:YheC/YheD family protein [Siminovitchia fortis]|nr:YheC/YheD family protein [Siminovitchia fortis]WHY82231.1 YheC/YheD family protein [Siminovitchia fortis]
MNNLALTDNQFIQIKNISDTLIEATVHFAKNISKREFIQSVHIFSSIVEGYEAISKIVAVYDTDLKSAKDFLKKIENNLVLTATHLEQKNYIKVTEIVQFSLLPNLERLNKAFTNVRSIKNSTITIGIYFDKQNPIEVYPKERIDALLKESNLQQANLIFFSSEDVNFETKKIDASVFQDGEWKKVSTDFPDVINNIGITAKHQQSITERKLRRMIPFTSFGVGNKFHLPAMMVKYRRFAELLVPFKVVTDEDIVNEYLSNEQMAVLKPISGARGERIYFVKKKGNRFTVSEHQQERILNQDKFNDWIQTTLLKFSYMIQRYVECKTKDGEPFDIRAHMQKDKKGKWQITRIYPRIGSKHSILSNISRGGRTEELKTLLVKEFGDAKGRNYDKELRKLSLELTEYLDRIHNFSLDELGLDLAIDKTGRFWLHEANNGPQSTYHEEARAVNTIGYAIYIAENRIVKHNQFQNSPKQFNVKTSSLPFAKVDSRYRIGMLKSKNEDDKLAVACAYVAHYENVQFYTFTPNDIDYNEMLIKGQFYENGKWVSKIVEYPNVIYDRFRLKGVKGFNSVYEELEGIPFTNEFYGNSISKLEVYDKLKSTDELNDIIIPYKKVEKIRDILQYIDEYGAVILKPEVGSFAKGVHYISKQQNNKYFVVEKDKETDHSEISLRKYLNELLDRGHFIVQQYINTRTIDGQPFDIRVHMMKDRNDEWSFASIYPRIGIHYATISSTGTGGYIGGLIGFLERNLPMKQSNKLEQTIKTVAKNVTNTFTSFYDERFNEIALDLALNTNAAPYLIEVNVNKPGIISHFDIAQLAIPNAIYLAEKTTK